MKTVIDILQYQATFNPNHLAISDAIKTFSYSQINNISNNIASHLNASGIGSGSRVALVGTRDAVMFVMLYGILRSGAAAVVIGSEVGEGEGKRQFDAAKVNALIRNGAIFLDITAENVFLSEDLLYTSKREQYLDVNIKPSDIAYLSFTSGSSGRPKAVIVTHSNVVHYAEGLRQRLNYSYDEHLSTAHVTTLAADLGHTSWLIALLTGGCVHVIDDATARDAERFWAAIKYNKISLVKMTPSHFAALLEEFPKNTFPIQTLILGGESLSRSFAIRLFRERIVLRLVNHYGPTETTIGATCFITNAEKDLPSDEVTVPIGTAIGDAYFFLEKGENEEIAELFIGGSGVSKGYFERFDETKRSFKTINNNMMYKTGDQCRQRSDGNLVFLGRKDQLVKVSGYRLDLAEIEYAVATCDEVEAVFIIPRATSDGNRLVAAIRLSEKINEKESLEKIRLQLRNKLPLYAIPAPIIVMDSFPLNANGKVDRDFLKSIIEERVFCQNQKSNNNLSQNKPDYQLFEKKKILAHQIATLWSESLSISNISIESDFFAFGGDSILAMRTVSLIRRLGGKAKIADVYTFPTPSSLATNSYQQEKKTLDENENLSIELVELRASQRWFFNQGFSNEDHWNQTLLLHCGMRIDPIVLCRVIDKLIRMYPTLCSPVFSDGVRYNRNDFILSNLVSFSYLEDHESIREISDYCSELNLSLDIGAGLLFRCHLFRGSNDVDDRLLFVAHHLVMDGISWRIFLDEFACIYREFLLGEFSIEKSFNSYYDLVAKTQRGSLSKNLEKNTLLRSKQDTHSLRTPCTFSWNLDSENTSKLCEIFGRGRKLEAFLLSAFILGLQSMKEEQTNLLIDVEDNGRDKEDTELFSCLGWFTTLRRVKFAYSNLSIKSLLIEVEAFLEEIKPVPMDFFQNQAPYVFNFLGSFQLPDEPLLDWSIAKEYPGQARDFISDPMGNICLTTRIINNKLIADIVYRPSEISNTKAKQVANQWWKEVTSVVKKNTIEDQNPLLLSVSGIPWRSEQIHIPVSSRSTKQPHVLLLGATGYLGSHILNELLDGNARVSCLVRAESDDAAMMRLYCEKGVCAVAGNLTLKGLGLSEAASSKLSDVDIVINAAADVHLFAATGELERTNVNGVQRLLSWIEDIRRPVKIHHVSTLSIAGRIDDGRTHNFSESNLFIGQKFITQYEKSKFDAERLVQNWSRKGWQSYIYRTSHIAANSNTGAFQKNISENRIYQMIRGYLIAREAPKRPNTYIAFSYVDTVASAISTIALSTNIAPGVYHIETPYKIGHDELIEMLKKLGYVIDINTFQNIDDINNMHTYTANSWAEIQDRGIEFRNHLTLKTLQRLGITFEFPTQEWLSRTINWGIKSGFFPSPEK